MTNLHQLLQKKTLLGLIRELMEQEKVRLTQALQSGADRETVWTRFKHNIALLQAKAAGILSDP